MDPDVVSTGRVTKVIFLKKIANDLSIAFDVIELCGKIISVS
jgi:hypothetical protein